jgi:molybdopterin-guanine dinucleotide biosynthesis protein A
VYILAGGKSRRFGSDKARATRDGEPLIVGVARELKPVASRVTVVAATAGAYEDLGLPTIGDLVPDKGPLGGLLTSIDHCQNDDWLFLTACDWAGIRAEWVKRLMESRTSDVQAVLYRSTHLQTLFALYRVSVRPAVESLIDAGRLSIKDLLATIAAVTLAVPDDWSRAVNINRPPA